MVTRVGTLLVNIPVRGEDYPEAQCASFCPAFGFGLNPIYECGNRGARILEDALIALLPDHPRDEHGDGL